MKTTPACKKHWTLLAAIAFVAIGMVAPSARAHTETVDGVEWQYANESDGVVIGSGGNAPAIPSDTAGALAIPSRLGRRPVIGIGEYAFYMCESLTEVSIPEGVADIGDKSFYCSGVTGVSIPGSVTRIGEDAFGECYRLAELAIPDSVEEIGDWAFYSCEGLTGITLPSGLARIGQGTFSWCYSLTELTIPDSVTSVGAGAFTDSGLEALSVPGSWKDTAILEGADVPAGCTVTYRGASGDPLAVATDALPPGTQWTFYSATLAASGGAEPYTWSLGAGSALPDGLWLSSDGSGIIDGVAEVAGEFTFTVTVTDAAGATASKELALLIEAGWTPEPEESETVAGVTWTYTVSGGRATVTGADPAEGALTVPSTLGGLPVAAIGEYAFEYRDGITGIVIPDSVEEIGNAAFSACEKLAKAVIGAGVTDIGTEAFTYCHALQAFEVAAANPAYTAVDGVLFDKAKTTLVQCPGGKAGDYAIPAGVAAIGESAFSGCAQLTRLTVPASVADIAGGAWTFDGCNALEAFEVAAANPAYAGQDGILFDKAMSTLIQYPCAKSGAYAIPDGVTDVGDHSFAWSENLTGLAMGNSVVRIGQQAFYGCVGLTDLALPEGLESIGYAALSYCTGLTQVAIPANVTLLPDELLFGCTALTDVTIPDGVTEIGGTAFYGCTALARVAMGSGVAVIGYGAFEDCTALETLAIPAATTEVGYGAFRNSGLKTLYVPASWEGTSMLDEAEVPEGCTIVYGEEEPAEETTTTGVPHSWLDENAADILAANGGDHEAAAKAPAANGRPVWECYVAGLSPTDPAAAFKIKSITVTNGEVAVEWEPDLGGNRAYAVEGKDSMADGWDEPDASSRFFRVRVGLPE